jgi:AraC-like DNA-binding protein
VSPHQLSETLNQTIGRNFNEYVNDFRVEEAKALLLDPAYRHYSILAVAYEVGFPSKSVFYKVFKDRTSQSPTGYIKAKETLGNAESVEKEGHGGK